MKLKLNPTPNNAFLAKWLRVGEMMEVEDEIKRGHILLRSFNSIISLTDPNHTYGIDCELTGRKLLPGESVTLTQ